MSTPSSGRHRIFDPDETTMLPRVAVDAPEPPPESAATIQGPGDAATTVFPAIRDDTPPPEPATATPDDAATTVFPAIRDDTPPPEPATATPDDTATTVFPAIRDDTPPPEPATATPDDTATTVFPAIRDDTSPAPATETAAADSPDSGPTAAASVPPLEAQHTSLLPAVRDGLPPIEEKKGPARRRWNEKLVPLRAKRTSEGYQSVHSELTRTTTGTILRGAARGTGEVLITLGVVVLLFVAYEMWGTTAEINARQDDMARELQEQWTIDTGDPTVGPSVGPSVAAQPPPAVSIGSGLALLHIPKLDKRWVVVEGVSPKDIIRNPGHYPGTAMPGQQGNFAVAGHRNRGTFWHLDRMRPCSSSCGSDDKIIVETKSSWFIYQVTRQRIVLPSAVEVVDPVPPGEQPGKLLTLTTCNPLLDNYERLIVHAKLVREQPKSAGRPAELGG